MWLVLKSALCHDGALCSLLGICCSSCQLTRPKHAISTALTAGHTPCASSVTELEVCAASGSWLLAVAVTAVSRPGPNQTSISRTPCCNVHFKPLLSGMRSGCPSFVVHCAGHAAAQPAEVWLGPRQRLLRSRHILVPNALMHCAGHAAEQQAEVWLGPCQRPSSFSDFNLVDAPCRSLLCSASSGLVIWWAI